MTLDTPMSDPLRLRRGNLGVTMFRCGSGPQRRRKLALLFFLFLFSLKLTHVFSLWIHPPTRRACKELRPPKNSLVEPLPAPCLHIYVSGLGRTLSFVTGRKDYLDHGGFGISCEMHPLLRV
jgi:hypothetical protein